MKFDWLRTKSGKIAHLVKFEAEEVADFAEGEPLCKFGGKVSKSNFRIKTPPASARCPMCLRFFDFSFRAIQVLSFPYKATVGLGAIILETKVVKLKQ